MTQSAVAYHLGVESQTVSRWERGERDPRREHLVGLADLLANGNLAELYREPEIKAAA